jgi:capsular exopolysaccharide synthesis family protein
MTHWVHTKSTRGIAVELHDYLNILRRRWLSILLIALTALALTSLGTLMMPKKYTATTQLFFAVAGNSVTDLAQGSNFAEKQISSYAEVATSPIVLDPVIKDLGLRTTAGELKQSIEATVRVKTLILEIAVTDPHPQQAAMVANAAADRLSDAAKALTPTREDGSETVRVTTLATAQVPSVASYPNISRNLTLGMILGLVLGIGIAVLREVLDTRVRTEQDVRALTESSILGVVGFDQEVPRHPVILRDEPLAAPSEAVRRLRTNLQFIDVAERPKSIVISSSVAGEGKSTIAINLAVSLADTGARVLLVDADLRRPSIAEYIGMEGNVGLTTVLIGRADVKDVVQPLGTSTLDILPAGQIPPNPSELLGSPAMAGLLDRLVATYDMVLLDSPPLLPVTDAAVLSKLAGGVLVVVGVDRIHRPQLQETLTSLKTASAHVFGIVMNKMNRGVAGTYSYESSYAPIIGHQSSGSNGHRRRSPSWDPDPTEVMRPVRPDKTLMAGRNG